MHLGRVLPVVVEHEAVDVRDAVDREPNPFGLQGIDRHGADLRIFFQKPLGDGDAKRLGV
jgi:hypothetical protein